ncbi:hypothetical protein T4D_2137 [Trichinella pseudospiralis]|uniref:Uncharacterized protein n=1 Tax=Trichinella pseudospiralis TaxID=6337 RepID=A0A0V1FCB1_TRIPS|nr:hypothetical protein T4D_2137 [Trichinella pseudospiralis]
MNRRNALKKLCTVMSGTSSRWMVLTTMHVKTHTYVLSNVNDLPSLLAKMGPAKSTPTYTKGPTASVLSGGSSAICCPNGPTDYTFPHHIFDRASSPGDPESSSSRGQSLVHSSMELLLVDMLNQQFYHLITMREQYGIPGFLRQLSESQTTTHAQDSIFIQARIELLEILPAVAPWSIRAHLDLPDPSLLRLPRLSRRQATGLLLHLHWQSCIGDEPQAPRCDPYQLSIAAIAGRISTRWS